MHENAHKILDEVKSGHVKIKVGANPYVNTFTALYKVTGSESQPQYKFGETKPTIIIDGLTAGQYYSFQDSASNAAGESTRSYVVSLYPLREPFFLILYGEKVCKGAFEFNYN